MILVAKTFLNFRAFSFFPMGKSAVIFSHLQSTKSGEVFILKWDILRGKIHDEMSFGGNVGQIQPTKETLLKTFHLTLTTLTINWTGDLNWDKYMFLGRTKLRFLYFLRGKKLGYICHSLD